MTIRILESVFLLFLVSTGGGCFVGKSHSINVVECNDIIPSHSFGQYAVNAPIAVFIRPYKQLLGQLVAVDSYVSAYAIACVGNGFYGYTHYKEVFADVDKLKSLYDSMPFQKENAINSKVTDGENVLILFFSNRPPEIFININPDVQFKEGYSSVMF